MLSFIEPLTYTWTWDGSSVEGVNPTVVLPLGMTTVTLTVFDGQFSDSDAVEIAVQDTTLPEISILVAPDMLWPPNHQMVEVTVTVAISDICDADPIVTLTSITSDEPDDSEGDGDGNTINDIQGAELGICKYGIFYAGLFRRFVTVCLIHHDA